MSLPRMSGKDAVRRAYSSSDIIVLSVTFVVFFGISALYFLISYFTSEDFFNVSGSAPDIISGLLGALLGSAVVFIGVLLFGMLLVKIQRQTMLGNSLQVEYSDFAWLRDWSNSVAVDLGMPKVEIFITQDPVINAYAFGYVRPYTIVLHSGS